MTFFFPLLHLVAVVGVLVLEVDPFAPPALMALRQTTACFFSGSERSGLLRARGQDAGVAPAPFQTAFLNLLVAPLLLKARSVLWEPQPGFLLGA